MIVYQWIPAVAAVLMGAAVLWLIRHDRLAGRIAIGWLAIAVVIAVLGLFPALPGWLAQKLGVVSASALVAAAGAAIILIKLLRLDIERSRTRRQMRLLTQKMAILEARDRDSSSGGGLPDKTVPQRRGSGGVE